jgi:hypothetical protein
VIEKYDVGLDQMAKMPISHVKCALTGCDKSTEGKKCAKTGAPQMTCCREHHDLYKRKGQLVDDLAAAVEVEAAPEETTEDNSGMGGYGDWRGSGMGALGF